MQGVESSVFSESDMYVVEHGRAHWRVVPFRCV